MENQLEQSRVRNLKARAKLLTVVTVLVWGSVNQGWTATKSTPAAATVVTGNARVDKLLGEMTLDEKIGMIHGMHENPATYQGEAGYLPGISRLGIPSLRLADGPPGVL